MVTSHSRLKHRTPVGYRVDDRDRSHTECRSIDCHRTAGGDVTLTFGDDAHSIRLACCESCREAFRTVEWVEVSSSWQ